jgi:hypothetical protein
MGLTIERILAWATAFVVVFSLYAHTVFQTDSTEVTPISAAVIAGGLALSSLFWFRQPVFWKPRGVSRQAGALVFFAAWALFAVLGLVAFQARAPTVYDWGLFLLTVGAPLLLLLNHERMTLLNAVGWWCVAFALADAVANVGGLLGWWEISDAGGRFTEAGRVQRFGGLTGNSHAGGIVCLVAICYVATRLRRPGKLFGWLSAAGLLVALVASLYLTDARRYLGEAVVAAVLLALPWGRFVPMSLVAAGLGAFGVGFAFTHFDSENNQRADLMAVGWREAQNHIWTGEGLFYRAPPTGVEFNDLWNAHVTESGVLDLAIAFGWLSTALLILAVILALAGRRAKLTWPAVILAVFTGELAYGNPIDGFLGAILFFGSLIFVLCEEPYLA